MKRVETLALLGRLSGAFGAALLVPLAAAFHYRESAWLAFALPSALGLFFGFLSRRVPLESADRAGARGGPKVYLFVVLAWVLAVLFAALPYLAFFGPAFAVDAVFESASGISTTGATIFAEVESLPRSLLLWRALTQWLGGLGIVILFVLVLGRRHWGVDVLTAEAPGPTVEKTEPRIVETARDTVLVGAALTAVLVVVLLLLDMPAFDAVCHALTTLATGGFSSRNAGLGAFGPAIQWTITGFMLLGGVRFAIHIYGVRRMVRRLGRLWQRLQGIRRPKISAPPLASYFGDPELRLYLGIAALATGTLFATRLAAGEDAAEGLRHAAFQAVAVITTTGYHTVDYNGWSDLARLSLLLLMFVGGCVGSTAGSVKVLRWVILLRKAPLAVRAVTQPHTELVVRVGERVIPASLSGAVGEFVLFFVGIAAAASLALVAMGIDPLTAVSAAAASVTNVGPGLGAVGPAASYGGLPAAAKLLLSALMIVGRLEVVTVAVLLLGPLHSLRFRLRSLLG